MDNFHIDVTCEGRETFGVALQLAWRHSRAVAYRVADNRMTLYWSIDERDLSGLTKESSAIVRLPYEMTAEHATEFVWGWLESGADYGTRPPIDGSCHKGWRVFCESWGRVNGDWRAFVAIEPCWAFYGK